MTGDDGIVAANIGNFFYGPSIFALEGDESEEGPYYSLIIADNTVTDAGQRNQNDDECGDCMPGLQIFEGEGENYGGDGIDVSGTSSALIESNEVDNSYDDGIVVSGFGDKIRGKREFYFEGPSEFGPTTSVVIRDNDVTNSGSDGIEVSNIDDAIVDVNRILNSGVNGFHAGGLRNGTVVLTGNTFTDNPVGALFESGLIDLTGEANTFNGGEVGLRFDPKNEEVYVGDRWVPYEDYDYDYEEYSFYEGGYWEPIFETVTADLNLVDDTIGTTIFNGQSQYYVELLDGALFAPGTPTIINGLDATYDGFRPSTVGGILTPDQYDALEAKIYHYNDLASLGLFFFGVVPGINDKDVYRAIDGFRPGNGSLNLTITGLPIVPGFGGSMANFLNGIAPAAGGNNPPKPQQFSSLVEQLANIAPAAGGDGNAGADTSAAGVPSVGSSACWGDALAAAGAGTIVNMSYDGSPDTALNAAASCQSGI